MESQEAIDIDLQKFWNIIKRRWLPATFVFTLTVIPAIVIASLKKPAYKAQGKLLIKKINQTSALTGIGKQIGELESLDTDNSPINTEMEIIISRPILEKIITTLNLKNKKGAPLAAEELEKFIKLKTIPTTDILQLSYESKSPQGAALLVNKLMSLYIENNVLTNRSAATAAGDFIAKQLPQTETTVRQAEHALRLFKERNHVVALEEESKSAVNIIQELESKITETHAALAQIDARVINLQRKIGMKSPEAIETDSLNTSPGIQKVLEKFQQVESELAIMQTRFHKIHPVIIDLKKKRNVLKHLVKQRVAQSIKSNKQVPTSHLQIGELQKELTQYLVKSEVEKVALTNRLTVLSKQLDTYKKRSNILPKLEQKQRGLERRLEAAQSTYATLLKKLQEVRVTENQNIGNARIIEPAFLIKKSTIKDKIILIVVGNALSILLATATIVILEVRDTSVKTLKEAKELFGYTLLGTIPNLTKKASQRHRRETESIIPAVPVKNTPHLPIAEAYRMLQANLKFLSSDNPLQVIVVTSSISKEGKSTVSANLAAAMAQLGRRVLLVDADMRHPLQHHIWNLTNSTGLSDVLVGQTEFQQAVCEGVVNLDVLTAGIIPPNPLALLDSKRMALLIEQFKITYDFVIIDAPSLAIGADAFTLGKMTDGILLVARPGVLNSNSGAAAKESIERSGQNVLGLVVNGVIPDNESDSYFYYVKEYYKKDYSYQQLIKSKGASN